VTPHARFKRLFELAQKKNGAATLLDHVIRLKPVD